MVPVKGERSLLHPTEVRLNMEPTAQINLHQIRAILPAPYGGMPNVAVRELVRCSEGASLLFFHSMTLNMEEEPCIFKIRIPLEGRYAGARMGAHAPSAFAPL